MNKILNWTFGSFFRTLGRIFVYILIGFLLSYLLKDVNLPKINIWQILDVSADVNIGAGNNNNFITPTDLTIYNNSGGTLSVVNGSFGTDIPTIYVSNAITFNQNGYGAVAGFNVNGGILNGYIYSISLYIGHGPITDNSYYKISDYYRNTGVMIGNSMSDIMANWNAGAFWVSNVLYANDMGGLEDIHYYSTPTIMYTYKTSVITYIFVANGNSQYIGIPFTNSINLQKNVYFYGYTIENLGKYDVVTNSNLNNAINNSGLASATSVSQVQSSLNQVQSDLNSSTNTIVNNQNQTKQEIINNANTNSQAEIQNANENTDKTIDSQKVCNKIDKINIITENKYLDRNGSLYNDNSYGITDFININSSTITPKVKDPYAYYCFYNTNKTLISCNSNNSLVLNENITIPNNASFVRFSIHKGYNQPQFEICKNGNQAIGDNLNDIGDKLTDSTPPSNLDSLNNSAGWLPAGPVDSILNLPLSFLTNLNSNLSKSCEPVNLPLPFINKNLPLPCVNSLYSQINGLPNWINTIGIIASAFILFGYLINLYKYIDDTLTFRENNYIDNWSGV